MNLELEAYEGELKRLRKIESIVRHEVLVEKLGNIYFICGEGGEKDDNGLPKQIHVCPAYGCDWFMRYERTDKTWGTEY
jgi:hypothetical protein